MNVPEFLRHPGPIPFAHRGGAGDHPENTMAAFGAAVDLGYRYLETDVRTTADGVLVAFHDDRLDRVTDGTGLVEELPWREVRRALVDGVAPIPRLEDLLAAWPAARFNLDAKHDGVVAPLAEALRRTGAGHRVCVAAFSDRRLGWLRAALGPDVCTAAGPRAVAALRATSLVHLGRRGQATCVQVPERVGRVRLVDRHLVAAAHRCGLAVHVWTVDDADDMARLLDLGVDGIMTDRPTVLKAVLEARQQWVA